MRRAWIFGWMLLGCGEESRGANDVELDPLCDGDGAVKLLDLERDEEVGQVSRYEGDRLRIEIADAVDEEAEYPSRQLIVSSCGGEVEQVGDNYAFVATWEGVLVGCDRSYDLVQPRDMVDPAPVLIAQRGCGAVSTPTALVAFDAPRGGHAGRLLALRSLGDGRLQADVLVDNVYVPGPEGSYFPGRFEDQIVVRTAEHTVTIVDPATGDGAVLIEGAADFAMSRGYVLYQRVDDVADGLVAVVLRDRDSGTESVLDPALDADGSLFMNESALWIAAHQPPDRRWFWLPDARPMVPPEGTGILTVLDDGMVWLTSYDDATGMLELSRWREGEAPESAMTCRACTAEYAYWAGGVRVRIELPGEDFELWFAPDAGGPAQRLGAPVNSVFLQLADERVLTVLGDDDRYGALVLHDHRADAPRILHPIVARSSVFLTMFYDVDGEILYEVADPAGEHALYRARLAPGD